MKRREFAKAIGFSALGLQGIQGHLSAMMFNGSLSSYARVPLGVCNHSLRSIKPNARQLIDYAIEQKLDSVLLNTLQAFESLETSQLSELAELARRNAVSIYVGVGSISQNSLQFSDRYGDPEALLIEGIRVASIMGSPIVGCRIGSIEDRYTPGGIRAHMDSVIKVMKSVGERARGSGMKFACENHMADLRSAELLDLINECGSDICGALFDPANALWAMEDPMQALDVLGSSILCTSVRDVAVWAVEDGAMFQGMAIGDGLVDYSLYSKTLARLCPGVPLHVESISNSARSIPYLKPDFWEGFPDLPGSEVVGLLRLVKQGKAMGISHPPTGESQKKFDIKVQQSELLKCLDFLRENCNAGLKISEQVTIIKR